MVETSEFESICPYNDEEAVAALNKVANHPAVLAISEYLFPDQPVTYLRNALKSVRSIDEFQEVVMNDAVTWCIDHTVHNFSYDGISYIKGIRGKFLAMSNHRDIILDPAITQLVFYRNGIPMTEICVGDNLIKQSKTVEYLLRSNRMIKVIRGISARDLYLSSQMLSRYIRQTITSGKASIWLAQRQGRTKDGIDTTEQGLLKMLDMSGEKSFQENFMELNASVYWKTNWMSLTGGANLYAIKSGTYASFRLAPTVFFPHQWQIGAQVVYYTKKSSRREMTGVPVYGCLSVNKQFGSRWNLGVDWHDMFDAFCSGALVNRHAVNMKLQYRF